MKCTNPNCDFCKAALETYGVTSGNEGGGKVQLGWAHPYYPISYGTQLQAPIAQQVAELESLGKTPKESEVKKGTWLLTEPKSNKWMEWVF